VAANGGPVNKTRAGQTDVAFEKSDLHIIPKILRLILHKNVWLKQKTKLHFS
jgi:hypothetical protein